MQELKNGRLDENLLFNLSAEPIFVVDSEGCFEDANPAFTEVFGWAPSHDRSLRLLDVIHEDDRPHVRAILSGLAGESPGQSNRFAEFICRIYRKTGGATEKDVRWSSWSAARVPNSPYVVARVDDIHDDYLSLHLFKLLVDQVPDFVAISKTNGQLIYVNPAGQALVGLSAEQISGMRHRDLIPADEMAHLDRDVLPELLKLGKWTGESVFKHSDGTRLPVHRTIVTLADERGNPIAYGSIAADLRALKQQESELLRLYTLLEHTTDLVAIADQHRQLQFINDAGLKMLSLERGRIQSLSIDDLMFPISLDISPSLPENENVSYEIGDLLTCEHTLRAQDGLGIPAAMILAVLRNSLGEAEGFALVARDLSERKALEHSLKNAILSLSNPILEVGPRLVALPIVGAVDSERASRMNSALLNAIASKQARTAILDLTGAQIGPQANPRELLAVVHQMMHGASLLGAECLLSGLSPELASAMVQEVTNSTINIVNTKKLNVFHTLKRAIQFAVRKERRRAQARQAAS